MCTRNNKKWENEGRSRKLIEIRTSYYLFVLYTATKGITSKKTVLQLRHLPSPTSRKYRQQICRKMRDDCMDCRHRDEDMYWSRSQTVRFCQILSGSFNQQLAIPKKFVKNVREKLAETVALKGPSGNIWDVGVMSDGDTLILKQGWKAFVEDHFLEENDILIFKYNGNSKFDVLMFDEIDFCEKEASYFLRKCTHRKYERGCERKRNLPGRTEDEDTDKLFNGRTEDEDPNELSNESSDDDVDYCPVKKLRRLPTRANAEARRGNNKGKRRSSSGIGRYPFQLTSRRRAVTEEEKERALEKAKANAASLGNSFTIVMRPSHVYRRFYMTIPSKWARVHVHPKSQDVVLRVKENTWHVKYHSRGDGGGLSGGWKAFVLDNFLEEFDACSFHLASGTNDGIVLDVGIFRVVEEVIPPRLPPGTSRLGYGWGA
ncbi:B3 domain-containing protein REM16 [Forsythia ovata]|uniref:B3 domain-containing protein REM16 n=1 Tax=Forsythia ovata TaxID=205694 RepID=A0ABD1VMZ0_9LAMI